MTEYTVCYLLFAFRYMGLCDILLFVYSHRDSIHGSFYIS